MKFTIAIPTYNNCSTIEKTLFSCLKQDFQDEYEVLVVDNACTDGTVKILDSFGDKIRRIRNNQTVTLYENHNICLNNAKGEYIIFCHSDDELVPDALNKLNIVLSKRNFPNKYVIWGRSKFRDYYIHLQRYNFPLDSTLSVNNSIKPTLHGGLTPSGTCYSVKSFKEIGGFLDTDHKRAPSDLTSMWKLALNGFEFEMSSQYFFLREYASTAVNSSTKIIINSEKHAIKLFLHSISEKEEKLFIEIIKDLDLSDSIPLTILLINLNIINIREALNKLLTNCLFQPKKHLNIVSVYLFIELLGLIFHKKLKIHD